MRTWSSAFLTNGKVRGRRPVVGLAEGGQSRGADTEEDDEDAEEHGQAAALCEALQGLHFGVSGNLLGFSGRDFES